MAAMDKAGATVVNLSDAERKRWADMLPSVAKPWAESMAKKGMPGDQVLKGLPERPAEPRAPSW